MVKRERGRYVSESGKRGCMREGVEGELAVNGTFRESHHIRKTQFTCENIWRIDWKRRSLFHNCISYLPLLFPPFFSFIFHPTVLTLSSSSLLSTTSDRNSNKKIYPKIIPINRERVREHIPTDPLTFIC